MKMYSMEDYNKAISLRSKGFTFDKISKILNIPAGTIYFWNRGALPLLFSSKHRESSLKKIRKYNEINKRLREEKYKKLILKITPEFAFVLGSILGDGCITLRKRNNKTMGQIELVTKDKDYATNFKESLEEWSRTKCKLIFYRNIWHVFSYSLVVARCLKYFDSSRLFNLNDKIKSSFLRGIFDAEGSVDVNSKKIIFANTSKNIIKLVENILESFNIKFQVYDRCSKVRFIEGRKLLPSSYFVIQISSKEGLRLFYEKIGFSIKRKNGKLKNIVSSYKSL